MRKTHQRPTAEKEMTADDFIALLGAAKRRGLNRSAMVSEALRAFISSAA